MTTEEKKAETNTPITDAACMAWCPKAKQYKVVQVIPASLAREMEVLIAEMEDYIRGFVILPGSKADITQRPILQACDALRDAGNLKNMILRFVKETRET